MHSVSNVTDADTTEAMAEIDSVVVIAIIELTNVIVIIIGIIIR